MPTRTLYRIGVLAQEKFRGIETNKEVATLTLAAENDELLEAMVEFAMVDGWRRGITGYKPKHKSYSA